MQCLEPKMPETFEPRVDEKREVPPVALLLGQLTGTQPLLLAIVAHPYIGTNTTHRSKVKHLRS
jgi:hypothetical protein